MKLRIAFSDFWAGFDPETKWFFPLISQKYDVEIVGPQEYPDILLYSYFGSDHLFSNARKRLYFTGENDVPDFNLCDYAISFHHLEFGHRHLRLPLYVLYPCFNILRHGERPKNSFNKKFCSFVVSNGFCSDPHRDEFFHKLSEYKCIDSGGRHLNNIGGPVEDKHAFLQNYKFNLCFENSAVDGYTTEKLCDALAAGTLPIYWGNPRVGLDFPKDTFIDVSSFKSDSEAIEYIIKVDSDPSLYAKYFKTDPIASSQYLDWESKFYDFFKHIVLNPEPELASFGIVKTLREDHRLKERLHRVRLFRDNIDKIEKLAALKRRIL